MSNDKRSLDCVSVCWRRWLIMATTVSFNCLTAPRTSDIPGSGSRRKYEGNSILTPALCRIMTFKDREIFSSSSASTLNSERTTMRSVSFIIL